MLDKIFDQISFLTLLSVGESACFTQVGIGW